MLLSPPDSRSDANRPARMFFFRGEGKGALAVSVDKSRAADRGANGPWREGIGCGSSSPPPPLLEDLLSTAAATSAAAAVAVSFFPGIERRVH